MSLEGRDFASEYSASLRLFTKQEREELLARAFMLGRAGVNGRVDLLDIAAIHQQTVESLLQDAHTPEERVHIIRATRTFLLECLAPFEMALRGFREANERLHELNAELEQKVQQRTKRLATTNTLLRQEIRQRRKSERTLAKQSRWLSMLRAIDKAILEGQPPPQIADTVIKQVRHLLACEHISIAQYDAARQELILLAAYNRRQTQFNPGTRLPAWELLDEETLETDKITRVEDILDLDEPSETQQAFHRTGIRSYICIPIRVGQTLFGSINLGLAAPGPMPEDAVEVILEIARQFAIASENTRLLQVERRRNEELEALRQASMQLSMRQLDLKEVLQTILEHAQRIAEADDSHIFLYDGQKLEFGAARWDNQAQQRPYIEPRDNGLTYTVARSGKPMIIPDANAHEFYRDWQWGGAIMALPLIVAGNVNGVMTLGYRQPHAIDEHIVRFLSLLADQAAIAINNAQLHQQVRDHAMQLEASVVERTEDLRRANERLQFLVEASPVAIYTARPDGSHQRTFTGEAISQHLGYPPDHYLDNPDFWGGIIHPEDSQRVWDSLRALPETREAVLEYRVRHRDGTYRWMLDESQVLVDAHGQPLEVIGYCIDITDRKQYEENLRRALEQERELSRLKSSFVSMVSHEFRTPLAVIQSSSDLLLAYEDRMSSENKRARLRQIQEQVRGLAELLDDVLTIYRAEAVGIKLRRTPTDLEALSTAIIREIEATTISHQIHVSIRGDCKEVHVDGEAIGKVIRNLVSNAVKYSPTSPDVYYELECDDERILMRVRDNGIGIPEVDQTRLFEMFHRARNVGDIPGTGLGLAIVKQVVDLHEGEINLETAEGKGTTFTITLPQKPAGS